MHSSLGQVSRLWMPAWDLCRACALPTFQHKCVRKEIAIKLSSVFIRCLWVPLENLRPLTRNSNKLPYLAKAITDQANIGFYHMSVGLLTNEWTDALGALEALNSLNQKWNNDICEDVWNTCNHINDNTGNHALDDEMVTLKDNLFWFQCHQHKVLDYRHHFLVNFTNKDL